MKISEKWLRSFVEINRPIQEIAEALTLRGLEIEEIAPVSASLSNIVVAEIISTAKHPNADKLAVCQVNNGKEILTIVCGAPNARGGLKVALAQIGAVLPGITIKKSKIRDVESHGMLCSISELGLAEQSSGIMELPQDAPLGTALMDYLDLDDNVLDISITPNRGDCVSVLGIAREVAAIQGLPIIAHPTSTISASEGTVFPLAIKNHEPEACPKYLARIISGINPAAVSPLWLKERLRRSGIRSITFPVDVTNYVMLALGQPMHAFDLQHISGDLEIRHAQKEERLVLLNEMTVSLEEKTLVIADEQGPLALAGIMGGLRGAVSTNTCDVLLECAHFTPEIIANTVRHFNVHSDSSYRFERGVDPELPQRAMALATQIILDIAGGEASVVETASSKNSYSCEPQKIIFLRYIKLEKVIGVTLAPTIIQKYLADLNMQFEETIEGLKVIVPSYRFDLKIEEDLIEEVLRIHGCDAIEAVAPRPSLSLQSSLLNRTNLDAERLLLKTFGYDEIISYSFVEEKLHAKLFPNQVALKLKNPISQDMGVMRTSLWTGLISTLLYNLNRQQTRVRLFEEGLCFSEDDLQPKKLSGLSYGNIYPESWSNDKKATTGFFDVKNDVVALLAENGFNENDYIFIPTEASSLNILHPRQSATIVHKENEIELGKVGVLHPAHVQTLGLPVAPVLFELEIEAIRTPKAGKKYLPFSKFPEVRRDLSFLIQADVNYQDLYDQILNLDSDNRIRTIMIFDVYQGKGIPEGQKSIALGIFMQDDLKTLTDDEVAILIGRVIDLVKSKFKATLRE